MSLPNRAHAMLGRSRFYGPLQRAYAESHRAIAAACDRPFIARAMRAWRIARPIPSSPTRLDPVPIVDEPFPRGRYIVMMDSIPLAYGGRPASVFSRIRLFAEHAGVQSEIVLTDADTDVHALRQRLVHLGVLPAGVTITRLQDHGPPGAAFEQQMDGLIGQDTAFVTVEWRGLDHRLLRYENPLARMIFVYHNTHLKPPFDNPARVRPSYRVALERGADIVFLTNAQRADAEALCGRHESFVVIPHPAVPAALDPTRVRDPELVVVLARLEHQKRLDHLLRAFAHVVTKVPGARLEVHGAGALLAPLQSLAGRLGITASVSFPGYTSSADAVYERAVLSVLTSRYEGFGLVVLESIAHGCPVVAYDVKYGPADIIRDGINGLLVEAGNIGALAAAIIQVLTDAPLRSRLAEGTTTSIADFDPRAFIARWSALCNRLAASTESRFESSSTSDSRPAMFTADRERV